MHRGRKHWGCCRRRRKWKRLWYAWINGKIIGDYLLLVSLVDEEVKGDEFWDYDQQVDLEGFTSGRLYGILAKQSREVTAAIARQKDQVITVDIYIEIKRGLDSMRQQSGFTVTGVRNVMI